MSVVAAIYLWLVHSWLFLPDGPAGPLSRAFIMVSIITLPHAVLVDRIYRTAS